MKVKEHLNWKYRRKKHCHSSFQMKDSSICYRTFPQSGIPSNDKSISTTISVDIRRMRKEFRTQIKEISLHLPNKLSLFVIPQYSINENEQFDKRLICLFTLLEEKRAMSRRQIPNKSEYEGENQWQCVLSIIHTQYQIDRDTIENVDMKRILFNQNIFTDEEIKQVQLPSEPLNHSVYLQGNSLVQCMECLTLIVPFG